jgi:hypothetical protein
MTLTIEMWDSEGQLFGSYSTEDHGWPNREAWERSVRERGAFKEFDWRGRAVFSPVGAEVKLTHIVDLR